MFSGRTSSMRHGAWIGAAIVLAACGAYHPAGVEGSRLERYGISLEVPDGWHAEITRGTVRLGTAPAGIQLGAADLSVVLYEYEPTPLETERETAATYDGQWPPRFAADDFAEPDAQGLVDAANAPGRRGVAVRGRFFNVFVEAGSRSPPARRVEQLNEALARMEIRRGDFYGGHAPAVAFPERTGWHVVSSGASPRSAQGEYVQTAAATIPYRNAPADLPPARTLEALPQDGILLWVSLSRDARFPPSAWDRGDAFERRGPPPYRLADLERIYPWEGQVRDIPQYRLWAATGGDYLVDLRVYFGREHPTAEMLAEADAVLRALRFPDWGPWELDADAY